jgi:hypothetical protein
MAEMSQLKRKQSLPDAQSVSEEEAALRDAIHAKLTYSLGKSLTIGFMPPRSPCAIGLSISGWRRAPKPNG